MIKVTWKRGEETQVREFREDQEDELITYNVDMHINGWEFVESTRELIP